jgi:anti-anti-sigma factor
MVPPENTYEMVSIMDNISTVMLPQQVDSETSASVETLIVAALRPGAGVIVDGSEVTYMSAAGVRVFARALHRAEEMGARIAFCRFTGAAADCLLVSGFTQLFEVVDSVEKAAARLRLKPAGSADERLHPHRRAG